MFNCSLSLVFSLRFSSSFAFRMSLFRLSPILALFYLNSLFLRPPGFVVSEPNANKKKYLAFLVFVVIVFHAPRTCSNIPLQTPCIYILLKESCIQAVRNFQQCSRNSTAIMASIFRRLHVANPRPLCDRFLRVIVRCFLRGKNNPAAL